MKGKASEGGGAIVFFILLIVILYYYTYDVKSQNLIGINLVYSTTQVSSWNALLVTNGITLAQYDSIANTPVQNISSGYIQVYVRVLNITNNQTIFNKTYSVNPQNYTIFTNRTTAQSKTLIVSIPSYGFNRVIQITP